MEKKYLRTKEDVTFAANLGIPAISYSDAMIAMREIISRNCTISNSYYFEIVAERDKSPLAHCLSAATGEFEITFEEVEDILFEHRDSPYRGKNLFILGLTEEEREQW